MIFESKWMIYGCIMALIVGAALVSPLLILNTVLNPFPENPPINQNPQTTQSGISANIKGVYLEIGSTTMGTRTQPTFSGSIYLEATKHLNDNQNIPDAEFDCFFMQIFSDTGKLIENQSGYVATAYNRSFSYEQEKQIDCLYLQKTFGSYYGGGGVFAYTWSIGTKQVSELGFSGTTDPEKADLITNSQTMTMTLHRIGTITIKNNSTVVSTSDAGLIETITLAKQGNGFFYNQDGSNKPIPLLSDR